MPRSVHLLPPIGPTPWGRLPQDPQGDDAQAHPVRTPEVTLPWAPSLQLTAETQSDARFDELSAKTAPAHMDVVQEDHVRLAVALDILGTLVAPFTADPTILAGLTDALLALHETHLSDAGLAGEEADTIGAALRTLALGPVGEARSHIAEALSTCTQALGGADSTPDGVHKACGLLVAGAAQVVRLARLSLDAQARPKAWRP